MLDPRIIRDERVERRMRNLNPSTVVGATALCIVMTGGGSGRADDGPAPTAAKVLRRLRPGHPRLLLTKEDLARPKSPGLTTLKMVKVSSSYVRTARLRLGTRPPAV